MRSFKQMLMGLPETGKTTFLAALWHVVDTAEVPESLILDRLDGDRKYLNQIRDEWANSNPIKRTNPNIDPVVAMHLRSRDSRLACEVHIPDMRGEVFRDQWEKRYCSHSCLKLMDELNGIILFINPNKVYDAVLIRGRNTSNINNTPPSDPKKKPIPYSHQTSPTQVKIVDLLQNIRTRHRDKASIDIAVIISAWDAVEAVYKSILPHDYLKDLMPFLFQYLRMNPFFHFKIFGVSAQGADLSEAGELRKAEVTSNRIKVVSDYKIAKNDITAPIQWILEQSQ